MTGGTTSDPSASRACFGSLLAALLLLPLGACRTTRSPAFVGTVRLPGAEAAHPGSVHRTSCSVLAEPVDESELYGFQLSVASLDDDGDGAYEHPGGTVSLVLLDRTAPPPGLEGEGDWEAWLLQPTSIAWTGAGREREQQSWRDFARLDDGARASASFARRLDGEVTVLELAPDGSSYRIAVDLSSASPREETVIAGEFGIHSDTTLPGALMLPFAPLMIMSDEFP